MSNYTSIILVILYGRKLNIPEELNLDNDWYMRDLCLFCCFTSQVNSYGHGGTVSSPNHTFLGKLELAVNQYFVHIVSLVSLNDSAEGGRMTVEIIS